MNIRDRRQIKDFAAGRLTDNGALGRIILIYSALALGLSAVVTVVNYVLACKWKI